MNKSQDMEKVKENIKENFKDIDKKIIIISNKGGVGKSSISINLVNFLAREGHDTGLFDADFHGPSVVKAMGFDGVGVKAENERIIPIEKDNMKVISMASFMDSPDTPLVWRGPMKMGGIRQFAADVEWGKLDYLIVDCPPGTGDEPLSVIQLFDNVDGGIVVTTPQDIALLDSRKSVNFLKKLNVPVLGILENMSGFKCPHCNKEIDLFKKGGGKKAAVELDVPYLGNIPVDSNIVKAMDDGEDFLKKYTDSPAVKNLIEFGKKIEEV
ncbi:MAG: P-loop NTPase [Elusimicrobiota bacterium]